LTARILRSGKMKCLLCKNTEFDQIAHSLRGGELINVKKCLKCGHVQLYPLPTEKEIQERYETAAVSIPQSEKKRLSDKEVFSLRDTIYNADLVSSLIPKGATVLDYGCGYGFFLKEMKKRKYNISGVDISTIRTAVAKKNASKIEIKQNLTDLSQKSFDCITAFHVLEHVRDPIGLLITLKSYLKPGGRLIIEVPNLDDHLISLVPEYKDFYWKIEHLSYFNAKTLAYCVRKAGLKLQKTFYYQRWDIFNLMNWVLRRAPQPPAEVVYFAERPKLISWLQNHYKEYLSKNKTADAVFMVIKS